MGRPRRPAALLAAAALLALIAPGCGGPDVEVLDEDLRGFRLGETFEQFRERVGTGIAWTEIPSHPAEQRDRMLAVAETPDHAPDIERARLSFFEDRLMEVILYYHDTSVHRLNALKAELEGRYGNTATSPDGAIEMAYKTYWIQGPGMSVTIRRITKKQGDELYVQYLHDGLHERFKAQKSGG